MSIYLKKYPHSMFVDAGRNAYKMMIHILNNPYKFNGKPYCDLWEKGYRLERRKYEGGPQAVPSPARNERNAFPARQQSTPHVPTHPGAFTRKPNRQAQRPPQKHEPAFPSVLDIQRVDSFNQRHRTAA